MEPDGAGGVVGRPVPGVHVPELAAAIVTAAACLDRPGSRRATGGTGVMVNLTLCTIFGFSIRARVQTRVAVGQLVIFRSVRNDFAHASKIATCAHFIGTCTLARV